MSAASGSRPASHPASRPARGRGRAPSALIPIAIAALVVVMIAAALLGSESVSPAVAIADASSLDRTIILNVRAPRIALAALSGGGLALVGAAFQALLRNPLAEPYVLGVSGGAALGAATAIALGLGSATLLGAALIPGAALAGGLGATLLVYGIARGAGGASGTSILLAGVMINAIAAALITLLKTWVAPSRAQELLRWLTGFIDLPSAVALSGVAVYVVAGGGLLIADAARLNLLALGDESAEALGVDVRALERRVFFASSCVVGAIVSLTGLIGFVGLVVPHALRRLIGPDHRALLPMAAIAGAATLVACDLLARFAFRWLATEPPVGAVTAILGGPAFLVLLRRGARA